MLDTFSSLKGLLTTGWATMRRYKDPIALDLLNEPVEAVHTHNPLVQIHAPQESSKSMEKTSA